MTDRRMQRLRALTNFPALIGYLRDELGWPIEAAQIEDVADYTYEYTPDELGIDARYSARITRIRQLRDFVDRQPWGIFYVEFESKRLPVMALRRILAALAKANADRKAWAADDLLFICVQGAVGERGVAFAHFRKGAPGAVPELRTFSWDSRETHFYYLENLNLEALRWPRDDHNHIAWRGQWRSAFASQHHEVIRSSEKLAGAMAAQAVVMRELVEDLFEVEAESGPLHGLLERFKAELLHDLTPDAFADMIAQTITYGLFAAAEQSQDLSYARIVEAIPKTNPFLRDLLAALMAKGGIDLAELGVDQLVALLEAADVPRITQDFMRQTGSGAEDPVVHFYEQFLSEYDRRQRVERGVFYTPDPVVAYIVHAVDQLLKTAFDLPDGLASDARHADSGEHIVQILDPATGTGTFLAHIIDQIAAARDAGPTLAWNAYVTEHLLPRLNGFELMMAPYTIAHMKLGLKLKQTGYAFASDQRLRVFLTNALESPRAVQHELAEVGALAREFAAAAEVKDHKPIMVVIGNPPYSGHSANRGAWIDGLIRDYYTVDGQPLGERNPKWLQDDYVKFIRFGQDRIERSGSGILAFITNHGYLDNPTFRGMRQSLLQTFDEIYILDLHGNSKKKETAPGGGKDENVFDIQQGVSIGIFVKHGGNAAAKPLARVHHHHLYGLREAKYAALRDQQLAITDGEPFTPQSPFYLFTPQNMDLMGEYQQGMRVTELFPINVLGFQTHRDDFAVHFDRETLEARIREMRDTNLDDVDFRAKYDLRDNRDWQLFNARAQLRRKNDWIDSLIKCDYRPFDERFCYFSDLVMDYPRRELLQHVAGKRNLCLNTMRQTHAAEWRHALASDSPTPAVFVEIKDGSTVFPLYAYPDEDQLFDTSEWPLSAKGRRPNLAPAFVAEVARLLALTFISEGCGDLVQTFGPEDIFHYAYAVFHSPEYRRRYAEFLKIDFPRLPLTGDLALFMKLAARGADLVALHLLDDDYAAASWNLDGDESPLLLSGVRFTRGADGTTIGRFGGSNYHEGRVYLDSARRPDGSFFEGVPPELWRFAVGGYQPLQKWLYDRRAIGDQPGRTLSEGDIRHYTQIAAALRETQALMNEIDHIIASHGGWPLRGGPAAEDAEEGSVEITDSVDNDELEQPTELTQEVLEGALAHLSGVEEEGEDADGGEPDTIQPFDPEKIRIETRTPSLDLLMRRIKEGEINLNPDFQRMGGIWNDVAQSRLIESLLVRIPLPAFYMDATDDNRWLVIDGLQRLTALTRFMLDKTLKLQKLEFWQEYNGKTFDDLSRSLQRRIEETQVTVYVVMEGTPHNVKFNIFKRINTGGVPLSGQEIRHALNLGAATDLLIELALSQEFKRATDGSVSPIRMADRECVLRFLAFTLKDYHEYTSRDDLDPFLNERMREINQMGKHQPTQIDILRGRFSRAMNAAHEIFGNRGFRKLYKNSNRRAPISKALFETWSVNLDKQTDDQIQTLIRRKKTLERKFIALMSDAEFVIAISYSTGTASRVQYRFSKIEQIIEETLNA